MSSKINYCSTHYSEDWSLVTEERSTFQICLEFCLIATSFSLETHTCQTSMSSPLLILFHLNK